MRVSECRASPWACAVRMSLQISGQSWTSNLQGAKPAPSGNSELVGCKCNGSSAVGARMQQYITYNKEQFFVII